MSAADQLDSCGCCEGISLATPSSVENPPGLSALVWRAGTHARFKQSMLAGLAGRPALRALTTRADDDPTIALIDSWAAALDVLTFYQERIANENYLRTATERRSILELARAIGYELAPGVSASAWLAFQLETAAGAPESAVVPAGTKVQSIPGQDERPQLYETSEDLDARAEWGRLPVKPTTPFIPAGGNTQLYLRGVATNLRVGDLLLIATNERLAGTQSAGWALRKVATIEQIASTSPENSYTLVTLDLALPALTSASTPRVFAMRQRAGIFGAAAMSWPALNRSVKADYLGLDSPDKLKPKDLVEWPDWSIYSPKGPLLTADKVLAVAATVQAVADAARNAATRSSADALHRAATSAQTVAAATGGAMASAMRAMHGTLDSVFSGLSTFWQSAQPPAINLPNVASQVIAGIGSGDAGEVNAALNTSTNAAIDAAKSAVNSGFSALQSIAQGVRTAGLPGWTQTGAEAMNALKSTMAASRASAFALGAKQAALAIEGAVNAAMSGIVEPASIAGVEGAATAAGTTVEYTADVANASLLIAAGGMIGGTAAAALIAGGIGAAELDADVNQFANVSVSESEVQELKNATTLGDAFNSQLAQRMLKLVKGASGEGAASVKAAVQAAITQAKKPTLITQQRFDFAQTNKSQIDLDNIYAGVSDGSYAVLARPGKQDVFRIDKAEETGRSQFLLSGKVTRLTLSRGNLAAFEPRVRDTIVYVQSEELPLAEKPLTSPHAGKTFILETAVTHPVEGRTLAVSGVDFDTGETAGETALLASASTANGETTFTTVEPLARRYTPGTMVFFANVVAATHGETIKRTLPTGLEVTEVLGSGDGAVPFQKFTLKQKPLTYVSAASASGRATSLRVRVDGVLWREVATFYGIGAEETVYVVRHADDGATTVMFGDGQTGARLPTGAENVTALYRVGSGLEGLVDAGQLSLLMSRPYGVKEVINPVASSGAEDPETLAGARENAPLTVLTLDRIVSLLDYEDFARAFAGIGKAAVTLLWTGEKQTVHLTVALADGRSPTSSDATLANLRAAVDGARHALRDVTVQGFVARPFKVTAKLGVHPDHEYAIVLAAARAALLEKFAFAQRSFAQDVAASEIIATLQSVAGVVFVDLDELAFTAGGAAIDGRLEARPARLVGGVVYAADLLTLADEDIQLTGVAP